MDVMQPQEFFQLKTEDILVIYKSGSDIIPLAAVEYWEECPDELFDDPYRINYYRRDMLGENWIINNDDILLVGIIEATILQHDCHTGGIYFAHEEDRMDKNVYEELYENYEQYNPIIFKISKAESKNVQGLSNGINILYVAD